LPSQATSRVDYPFMRSRDTIATAGIEDGGHIDEADGDRDIGRARSALAPSIRFRNFDVGQTIPSEAFAMNG
jgi:hypothetical protein